MVVGVNIMVLTHCPSDVSNDGAWVVSHQLVSRFMHGFLGFWFNIKIMFTSQVWVHGEMDLTREFITINEFRDVEGLDAWLTEDSMF